MYRRGQALAGLQQYRRAEADLQRAVQLSANDAPQQQLIQEKLTQVQQQLEQQPANAVGASSTLEDIATPTPAAASGANGSSATPQSSSAAAVASANRTVHAGGVTIEEIDTDAAEISRPSVPTPSAPQPSASAGSVPQVRRRTSCDDANHGRVQGGSRPEDQSFNPCMFARDIDCGIQIF